jgi:hypothetical protein
MLDANYDSTLSINALSLPILIKYIYAKPGNWGLSVDAGLKLSYLISTKNTVSGNFKTSGDYPVYLGGIILDDTEYGFFTRTNIDESDNLEYKKINLSAYAKLNIVVPLGFYSSLELGPEILYGLNNLENNNSDYIDIFGKSTARKPVTLSYFGVNIKFVYKL